MTKAKAIFAILVMAFAPVFAPDARANWAEVRQALDDGDATRLVNLLIPMAEDGDAHAQHTLGILYDTGQGVMQDHATAARWYRTAGEQDHRDALYNLALLYFEGKGVDMNRSETFLLYRQAAQLGEIDSLSGIGYLHQYGIEVKEDPIEAMAYYLLAAERGSVLGERNRDRLMQEFDTNDFAFARQRLTTLRTEYSP